MDPGLLDAGAATALYVQSETKPCAAATPAWPCAERPDVTHAGLYLQERHSGASANGSDGSGTCNPTMVDVYGMLPPGAPLMTERRLESERHEAWRLPPSELPGLTDRKLEGDCQAFLAACQRRLQGAEEVLRRDGSAIRGVADEVPDRLGRRVDERLREMQPQVRTMESRLSGQLSERMEERIRALEYGSKAVEVRLDARISERLAAFEDVSKVAERRLIASAEARAVAFEAEAKASALQLSAQISERLATAQAEIKAAEGRIGTQVFQELQRHARHEMGVKSDLSQENIVEATHNFRLQLDKRCMELETTLADARRQLARRLDERCSELDERLAEVESGAKQQMHQRGASFEHRLAETEDALRHLLDERLSAAQVAATEQYGQLEYRVWSWQEEFERRTISTERALGEFRREMCDNPVDAALQRLLPDAAPIRKMREQTRDLAKAAEALRLRLTEFEDAITRRVDVFGARVATIDSLAGRVATIEEEIPNQMEALLHSAAETRLRVEEVARQHAQRLAVAELMHQRLDGRIGALDERLQSFESNSNDVVCRAVNDVSAIQRRMLQLVDGAEVVLRGGGGGGGERGIYDSRLHGGVGGVVSEREAFDGRPRGGGGGSRHEGGP